MLYLYSYYTYRLVIVIEVLIRQCHFPSDQNRAEDRYEEEAEVAYSYSRNEEGQLVFQPDLSG